MFQCSVCRETVYSAYLLTMATPCHNRAAKRSYIFTLLSNLVVVALISLFFLAEFELSLGVFVHIVFPNFFLHCTSHRSICNSKFPDLQQLSQKTNKHQNKHGSLPRLLKYNSCYSVI